MGEGVQQPDELKLATEEFGRALNAVSPEEKESLKDFRAQIDAAVKADPSLDHRIEFCQAIIFSPDKISSKRLIQATKNYLELVEKSKS